MAAAQGGGGGGGVPMGALIPLAMMLGNAMATGGADHGKHLHGCASGHVPVSQCAWCQRQMQLMRQEQQARAQPQRRSVHAATQSMDMDTAAGATVPVRAPLPEGKRIDAMSVKSPYSAYIMHSVHVQPGHIVTDHSITPKKNFVIPKQVLGQED